MQSWYGNSEQKYKGGGGGGGAGSVNNAFMLNDCKYLYNMYRRWGMLYSIVLLICITKTIISY